MTQSDLIHESVGIVLDALSSGNIGPAVAQKQLETAVANIIAAAVKAERENGRIVEVALRSLIEEIDNFPGIFNSDSESVIFSRNALEKYEDIQSAAIRASGEVTK